jgi:ribulose 1,5-bisphosphate synthetase/thiazole synthase
MVIKIFPFLILAGIVAGQGDVAFDYVIAGAGTAGLVLANRLSADPKVSVALSSRETMCAKMLMSKTSMFCSQASTRRSITSIHLLIHRLWAHVI